MPDISEVLKQVKDKPENFPRYFSVLQNAAEKIRRRWLFMASERAKISVKGGGLGWWGEQYLASGQIQIEPRGIGYRVFYDKDSKYDFEKIAEDGRPAYDIVSNLLNKSKKVRISKNGKKYLIVPLPASKDSNPDVIMRIIGSYKETSPNIGIVKRNKYSYVKVSDKTQGKKVFQFMQKHERKGSSSSKHHLIAINSESSWSFYPEIKGQKFTLKMQQAADQILTSNAFVRDLAEALYVDIQSLKIKKQKEKKK